MTRITPCDTCVERPAWPSYAQCLSCLRYEVRPDSDPGTGEVPRIRLMTSLLAEDGVQATRVLQHHREVWEQTHPGWIPCYLGAFREYRRPAREETLGRYWYEVRYILRKRPRPHVILAPTAPSIVIPEPFLIDSRPHWSGVCPKSMPVTVP